MLSLYNQVILCLLEMFCTPCYIMFCNHPKNVSWFPQSYGYSNNRDVVAGFRFCQRNLYCFYIHQYQYSSILSNSRILHNLRQPKTVKTISFQYYATSFQHSCFNFILYKSLVWVWQKNFLMKKVNRETILFHFRNSVVAFQTPQEGKSKSFRRKTSLFIVFNNVNVHPIL